MKLNEKLVIYGTRVILVPYDKEHVEKYHGWMQNKDILEATASEPLSIENEYKMQESWRNDEDKLTFIVLSAQDIEDGHGELDAMIGDVNLFLNDPEDDCCGEVEVMIAESRARQKGCATEALKLLMGYCYDKVKVSKFIAKIGKHNLKSYSLFKNKVIVKSNTRSILALRIPLHPTTVRLYLVVAGNSDCVMHDDCQLPSSHSVSGQQSNEFHSSSAWPALNASLVSNYSYNLKYYYLLNYHIHNLTFQIIQKNKCRPSTKTAQALCPPRH